jgi:hypothetical protein
MRRRHAQLWMILLSITAGGPAHAATLAEFASWCAPEGGRDRLCQTYLETYIEGLASTDPVMNGGNRACVPPDADRNEIIRVVRAYAAGSGTAGDVSGVEGLGTALKGRYPCP